MDSTAHAILQARILEWVAAPSPGDLLNPRIKSRSPTLQPYSLSAEPTLWWVFYNHFDNRGSYSQSCGFSSSHVQVWELDQKEGWVPKNWCLQIAVLEKILESFLDSREIKPINPKGNYPWIFTGRTDAEAEAPILCPPDAKSQLIGKDTTAGKEWGQEEKKGRQRMRWVDGITDSMDIVWANSGR